MARPQKALVVDDLAINRLILGTILQKLGLEVLEAENGLQCIEVYNQERTQLVCVFLDLQMPVADGWAATKGIRELESQAPDSELLPVPVVVCTASCLDDIADNGQTVAQRAVSLGANGAVRKPLTVYAVRRILDEYAPRWRSSRDDADDPPATMVTYTTAPCSTALNPFSATDANAAAAAAATATAAAAPSPASRGCQGCQHMSACGRSAGGCGGCCRAPSPAHPTPDLVSVSRCGSAPPPGVPAGASPACAATAPAAWELMSKLEQTCSRPVSGRAACGCCRCSSNSSSSGGGGRGFVRADLRWTRPREREVSCGGGGCVVPPELAVAPPPAKAQRRMSCEASFLPVATVAAAAAAVAGGGPMAGVMSHHAVAVAIAAAGQ